MIDGSGGHEDQTYFGSLPEGSILDGTLDAGELPSEAESFIPDDYDIVSGHIEEFMYGLYGTDRYAKHNDRILAYHDRYSENKNGAEEEGGEDDNGSAAGNIDRMAIILHDFVEHTILRPEKTAAKLVVEPEQVGRAAAEIRDNALTTFNQLLDAVGDQDGLIKAYLFAIDTSKWEAEARKWRDGANERIVEMVADGNISARNAGVMVAAINKTPDLDGIGTGELEQVLRNPSHYLRDLKLGSISDGTMNHNIKGLYFKALETLDLIEHPPAGNPASTYRDCTEAVNFFVPALMALGYKRLAIDLRDRALQWFFDDPNGDARSQHSLSQVYFEDIKTRALGLLESDFGGIEVDSEARVKSEGSLREKLARDNYIQVRFVPDGDGLAFIVPDDMSGSEMTHFAEEYARKLGLDPQIGPGHPNGSAFEDRQGDKQKKSGYGAINMTFYYHPFHQFPAVSPLGHKVPFEIQVLTREQNRLKMYGRYSDLFYKAGTEYLEADQPYLDHLAGRARAEREIAPGSTVQSIAEMAALSPEIPSVFNKLFRAVEINGAMALVPPELEQAVRGLPPGALGEAGDLTVLPANRVTEPQFLEAISMFSKELATDKNVVNALELVKKSEAGTLRNDGTTQVLEGHILPTTLSAVMLAIQSGKIWGEGGPVKHISNITTISLLHDYIEKALEDIDDMDVMVATYQSMLFEIKHKFDSTIMEGVDAMTVPFEIEDETERRNQYSEKIKANKYAIIIKPEDRDQNHVADITRLSADYRAGPSSPDYEKVKLPPEERKKIMDYFAKTDRHLSEIFLSKLPDPYARTHKAVMALARSFGYESAA